MMNTLPMSATGTREYLKDEYGNKYYINSKGQKVYAEDSNFYIGYNSNTGIQAEVNGLGISQSGLYINGNNYTNSSKPIAYKANAAGTANSIAQGGMTKQEIQEFNSKHPNETAWRQS